MNLFVISSIILIGLLLIVIELFIFPGITAAGIVGGIIVFVGIVLSYTYMGFMAGNIALLVALLTTILLSIIASRTLGSKTMALHRNLTNSKVNEIPDDLGIQVGDIGKAYGDIKPSGKIAINKRILQVFSQGAFIPDNAKIEIIEITKNKIYVKAV